MNLGQHWTLSCELRRWPVQEPGNVSAVKRLPTDQFRIAKSRRSYRCFARCPTLDFSRDYIQRIAIALCASGLQAVTQVPVVSMPDQSTHYSDGNLRNRTLFAGGCIQNVQFAESIFIAQKSDPLAVPRLLELIDVPGQVRRHDL